MRITAELIYLSPQFVNPINEREIDLRGNKISIIENLGATKVKFLQVINRICLI
jgi:U2 small nuclear ribonucleoprotein A'